MSSGRAADSTKSRTPSTTRPPGSTLCVIERFMKRREAGRKKEREEGEGRRRGKKEREEGEGRREEALL